MAHRSGILTEDTKTVTEIMGTARLTKECRIIRLIAIISTVVRLALWLNSPNCTAILSSANNRTKFLLLRHYFQNFTHKRSITMEIDFFYTVSEWGVTG